MIFLGTNVISETLRRSPSSEVMTWLAIHDDSLAIPAVTIAEIAYGIAKIRPDERSDLLQQGLDAWRQRFAGRIFALTEQAGLVYGEIMGAAHRAGSSLTAPDGMILDRDRQRRTTGHSQCSRLRRRTGGVDESLGRPVIRGFAWCT